MDAALVVLVIVGAAVLMVSALRRTPIAALFARVKCDNSSLRHRRE